MGKARREKVRSWRFQWGVVMFAAVALVAYNAVANLWLLHPAACPLRATAPPSEPPTCEPCAGGTLPSAAADDDPISRLDLRLGRWDGSRSYRLFDYAAVGDLFAEVSANSRVCLATQSSIERLHELLRIAAHWTGPISVAVFVAGDELRLLRAFTTWLFRCQPEIYSRLALHVTMPSERPGLHGTMPTWARDCDANPLPVGERRADTVAWRARHPYPQNHMRNLARKNCHTPFVFLVDVDIVPSKGMADALDSFLESTPKCPLCAYVVPTYELDRRVAKFPANKSELVRLSRRKLAIPFHRKVFIYNQYASNFSRWEASGGNESLLTHISHNVTNFELLYEPFYVAADTVPAHDERFLGYGFTRNTQVCKRRYATPCHNHVICILYKNNICTKDMMYGQQNEHVAKSMFMQQYGKIVRTSGLFIDEDFGFLAASPDGIIEAENTIVEIKCLPSLKRKSQNIRETSDNRNFPIHLENDVLVMNKKHNYYYQVQGQLQITKMSKCYFVCFISVTQPLTVIEVNRDEEFINAMMPKLVTFFKTCLLPEIILRRVEKNAKCLDIKELKAKTVSPSN